MIRPSRRLVSSLVAASFIVLAAWSAAAHDLWILPPESAQPGATLEIRLTQGMDFPLGTEPPEVAKFQRFFAIGPDGKPAEIAAGTPDEKGKAARLLLKTTAPGLYAVAVETTPKVLSLEPDAFNAYLVSDGMPDVFLERSKNGTLKTAGRERYSKTPKMLLMAGDGPGDPSRVLGLKTEIVPLADPFKLKPGMTLPVRVLFTGRSLADVWLGWDTGDDGDLPSGMVRTNAKGEALVPIAKSGLMTLRVTYMTHPAAESHEWESFWTTLTFRVP